MFSIHPIAPIQRIKPSKGFRDNSTRFTGTTAITVPTLLSLGSRQYRHGDKLSNADLRALRKRVEQDAYTLRIDGVEIAMVDIQERELAALLTRLASKEVNIPVYIEAVEALRRSKLNIGEIFRYKPKLIQVPQQILYDILNTARFEWYLRSSKRGVN